MKRTAIVIMALLAVGLAVPALAAHDNDFQTIQKAVKKNPAYEPGREARWLKILIMDRRGHDERVSVKLPLALIDVIMNCGDSRHFRVDDGDCEIDLKALWKELKKAGPTALIELRDDDALIKIWLE